MSNTGGITVELRRSQAVHERAGAGLASYEPDYDPEGLTVEAAIELAACITRSPWPFGEAMGSRETMTAPTGHRQSPRARDARPGGRGIKSPIGVRINRAGAPGLHGAARGRSIGGCCGQTEK